MYVPALSPDWSSAELSKPEPLVVDQLYEYEAPVDKKPPTAVIFIDPLAAPALLISNPL